MSEYTPDTPTVRNHYVRVRRNRGVSAKPDDNYEAEFDRWVDSIRPLINGGKRWEFPIPQPKEQEQSMTYDAPRKGDEIRLDHQGLVIYGTIISGPNINQHPHSTVETWGYAIGDVDGVYMEFRGKPTITILKRPLEMPPAVRGDVFKIIGKHGLMGGWAIAMCVGENEWEVFGMGEHADEIEDPIAWAQKTGVGPLHVVQLQAHPEDCDRGSCWKGRYHEGECRD